MYASSRSGEPTVGTPASNPLVIVFIALLWLTFACALPMHQVSEERRHAHQELSHLLAANKLDQTSVFAAFDQANTNLDAAATGPSLLLACTIVFLVTQLLKSKRRYHALSCELETRHSYRPGFEEASEDEGRS